jgi:hypothetical protein
MAHRVRLAMQTLGMEPEIEVDTFNFTRYGLLHGKVVSARRLAVRPSCRRECPR